MSYEEGVTFDNIEASEYMKYKMIILNKIFVKNNQHTHRLMHGDYKYEQLENKNR